MKCVRLWGLAKTHVNHPGCGESELIVNSAALRKSGDGGIAGGDHINELVDEIIQALGILAVAELGNDALCLSADVVESVLDTWDPCGRPLGDSTGKGHSTGGKDAEDGGETHDEDV